jgi:transposase
MKRNNKYVALDVHQATTSISVRDPQGRVIARSIVPTAATPLVEYFQGMRGAIHVAFEEGTQAHWLHELLSPVVDRVIVCDRRGERRSHKSDRRDADLLSRRLLTGDLRAVYHDGSQRALLRELTRTYCNLTEDGTRTMLRLKALFRARAIRTRGQTIYTPANRAQWLAQLTDRGARFRAQALYAQLDVVRELRPQAKLAMVREARRDPAWHVLRSIPYMGPVRVSLLLATMKTPWRFRTKRNLWAYAGLAVVTESSADHEFIAGRATRRRRKPLTRGLNQNHNRILKNMFKSAAISALARPGELQDFYRTRIASGMRPEMARLTLARKFAALTLHIWKTGEAYDAAKLTVSAT